MPAEPPPNGRPTAHGPTRDKLVAGVYAALHGIDASQIPTTGIHCNVHIGDVMAIFSVWPWDLSRPALQPGEHPFRVERIPVPPSSPPATSAAPDRAAADGLPSWLSDLERAVYEAASDALMSAKRIARIVEKSDSRVREAIARLTACDPPLLMRGRGGVRRVPRN